MASMFNFSKKSVYFLNVCYSVGISSKTEAFGKSIEKGQMHHFSTCSQNIPDGKHDLVGEKNCQSNQSFN